MSERVCYIRRTDRGGALKGLRLIGGQTDDVWQAGASTDPVLMNESIRQGARWIADRLGGGKGKNLAVLCLDTDGAVCTWVKPADANSTSLEAALSSDMNEYDPDSLEQEVHNGIVDRFPKLPLELSYEPLPSDDTSTGSRAAVMAGPDIPGRLIKDELDTMGIQIGTITSIWHAIASTWDPGAKLAHSSSEHIVSSDSSIVASIVLDPDEGRLIWTWSRSGKLITAGSARIEVSKNQSNPSNKPIVLIRPDDIARICSDWLSWSSQLGVSPTKIVFVGEPGQIQSLSNASTSNSSDDETTTKVGMSPSEVGVALTKAWPDATIDLVAFSDPIGETLSRVAGDTSDRLKALSTLTNRPGRAHRGMYRWAGAAFIAVSAIIAIAAYQLLSQAGEIKDQAALIAQDRMQAINDYDPQLVLSQIPAATLRSKLDQVRKSHQPVVTQNNKPIMEELETISFVLGIPGIEIDTITLNNSTATVVVRVDGIVQAEAINQSLSAIKGSHLRWYNMTPTNRGEQIQATYSARWDTEEGDS